MKNSIGSSLLLVLALGALGFVIADNPPGGVRWGVFGAEEAPLLQKVVFLFLTYAWPGFLSCFAISMFQLQARLAASGANKRTVFSICVFASGTMLLSLRSLSLSPTSGIAYVAGMAMGYTLMARLYAVRMRTFFGRVSVPWPIWRGDTRAVQAIDEMARMRRAA
ncbi:MAG: hypothetical protein ABIR70_14690 [Bryobacteraceae bacterium]